MVIADNAAEKGPEYSGLSVWATVLKLIQFGVEMTENVNPIEPAVGDTVVTYQISNPTGASYPTMFYIYFDSSGKYKTTCTS